MMPPTKASKIIKDYSKNNFNAKKTLIENGYSEKTAIKNAGRTINTANETIKKHLQLPQDTPVQDVASVLDIVGFTRDDVIKELVKVITQDKDLTNKLKAMKPLLDSINYKLDDTEAKSQPILNLTVEKVELPENPQP